MLVQLNRAVFRRRLFDRGWTAAELGRRVGISSPQLTRWSRGQRPVPLEHQKALAGALGGRRGLFEAWTGPPVRPVGRPRKAVAG